MIRIRPEGKTKLLLPYEKGWGKKIKSIAKKHFIDVIFISGQTLKQRLSIPRGNKLEKLDNGQCEM